MWLRSSTNRLGILSSPAESNETYVQARQNEKLLLIASLTFTGVLWAESLYFDGKTDKNPVLYKAGEPMTFLISLQDKDAEGAMVKGRKLVWNRTGDDGKPNTAKPSPMNR